MRPTASRAAAILAVTALAFSFGGCSWMGSMRPPTPEIAAPDTTLAPEGPEAPPPNESPIGQTVPPKPARAGGARRPAPAATDTTSVAAPEHTPSITVRLSPQERVERETKYYENLDRAVKSLNEVRKRVVTRTDREQLAAADQFLSDARRAFEASDLTRACAVAEKARVLAEELRARLAPP